MILFGVRDTRWFSLKEGRKVRSGYLPFRTNASTFLITPKRSSSRDEGTTDQRGRSQPPQCTTSREDRQIVHMAVTVTSRTVAQHIESATYHSVSARTIQRRLQ
ncbi:transposable element Tcb1 transposase [Trichonephila clavipes]|nr:transposable element Tcb1 transposase [Trichonephila clavipes]